MRTFRWAVVLAAPVAVVLAAQPAAHASVVARAAAVAPAFSPTNLIYNATQNLPLGVIQKQDGSYADGNYDAVLQPFEFTSSTLHWTTAAGWYTAPGYCTQQWRSSDPWTGVPFVRQLPDLGAGRHFIGAFTSYEVSTYRC